MNKENEVKDIKVIEEALGHLKPFTKEEILADLERAEGRNLKNKKEKKDRKGNNLNLGNFLKKHKSSNIKLDSKENRVAFDKDICMILKSFRDDFIPLLEVYNFLMNQGQCDVLKKHVILKGNFEDESTNDEIVEIPDDPVITINVDMIDNDSIYYSNIVKGVLNMMNANFEKTFMKHHFKTGFLYEFNSYDYYQNNLAELKISLANVIEDINRYLNRDKLEKNKLMGAKIQKKDFISIIGKAFLEKDTDLLIQIYEKSNSNDEIISNLKEKKYDRLIAYINEYLEINELKKLINTQNVQMEKLKKDNQEQIEKLKKDNQEQMEKLKNENQEQIEKLKNENQEQNVRIEKLNEDKNAQSSHIEQLTQKVDYLDLIMNALISRKVINHSINKFLIKYKASLEKTKKQKQIEGKMIEIPYIKVKNDINGVPSKDCQDLIDLLFNKKDLYNDCVHFNEIKKPSFVGDVWETVINFIQLNEEEKVIFNKIFTEDIKKSFKFSQKDIKIEL